MDKLNTYKINIIIYVCHLKLVNNIESVHMAILILFLHSYHSSRLISISKSIFQTFPKQSCAKNTPAYLKKWWILNAFCLWEDLVFDSVWQMPDSIFSLVQVSSSLFSLNETDSFWQCPKITTKVKTQQLIWKCRVIFLLNFLFLLTTQIGLLGGKMVDCWSFACFLNFPLFTMVYFWAPILKCRNCILA